MERINTADGLFHEGNPATGEKGTKVTADWLNALQDEVIYRSHGWLPAHMFTTLAEADAAAVVQNKLLVISTTFDVVPSVLNANLKILPGGGLNSASDYTITGKFTAGLYQVFWGTGAALFARGSVVEVFPEWWGATGSFDEDVDNSPQLAAAINSFDVIRLTGTYRASIDITAPNKSILGGGVKNTAIYCASGACVVNVNLDDSQTSALPLSFVMRDLSIVGETISNPTKDGLRLQHVKTGDLSNVEFNFVNTAISTGYVFSHDFNNIFIRNYNVGLVGSDTLATNNNSFRNFTFYAGNTANSAVPMKLTLYGENLFENITIEGSGQMAATDFDKAYGNTFVNLRMESCTAPGGNTPYLLLSGKSNHLINPLITLLTAETLGVNTYLIEVSGDSNVISNLGITVATRIVKFTPDSMNCKIALTTENIINQIPSSIIVDYGSNNTVSWNGADFTYNNEVTFSYDRVENGFTNSGSMSGLTLIGLTQTTVTGAASRLGPFKEGLIQLFTETVAGTGGTWEKNVFPTLGVSANKVASFSFWAKSANVDGEYISVLMGRSTNLLTVSRVFIPGDKFIRIVEFQKFDTTTYTDYYVGVSLDANTSGVSFYGPQVRVSAGAMTNGLLPHMAPGGFVPTEATERSELAPNYALFRKHAIAPVNGTGYLGTRIGKISPAVGSPKGWLCTATGTPGTWVSEGDL